MTQNSLFDIVGPVMVGPSSSHTYGAVRLGNLARIITDKTRKSVTSVEFVLYNSFAKTGKGHGTDKGLLAGFMGYTVGDSRVKEALALAKTHKLNYKITNHKKANHFPPNTARFVIQLDDGSALEITGHSIGGGKVYISQINKDNVVLHGETPTLVLFYKDKPGMIWQVTKILAEKNINIADLICKRRQRDIDAFMTITMDSMLLEEDVDQIRNITDIFTVWALNQVE